MSSFLDGAVHFFYNNPERFGKVIDAATGNLVQGFLRWNRGELQVAEKPEGVSVKANENFRPVTDILKAAVETYDTGHQDAKAFWKPEVELYGLEELKKAFDVPLTASEWRLLFPGFIPQAEKVYGTSDVAELETKGISLISLIKAVGAGKLEKKGYLTPLLVKRLDNLEKKVREAEDSTMSFDEVINKKPILDELQQKIEKRVAEQSKPVSTQFIIEFYLQQHSGDLNRAIEETTFFVKYMSRMNSDLVAAANWMRANISDEFSPHLSYQDLPAAKQKHEARLSQSLTLYEKIMSKLLGSEVPQEYDPRFNLVNRVGTIYHAISLVDLLRMATPQMVMVLTSKEYLTSGGMHGSVKALADALQLKNLGETQAYLKSLAPLAT